MLMGLEVGEGSVLKYSIINNQYSMMDVLYFKK